MGLVTRSLYGVAHFFIRILKRQTQNSCLDRYARKIIRNSLNRKLPIKFEFDLELFLVGCFGILFGVHEFVDDLTFVASGVVMIGVLSSLFFGPLFSGMAREN